MTMRLDLHTRPQRGPYPPALINPDCYGCADCGQWFQFARQLVLHVCEERDYDSSHQHRGRPATIWHDCGIELNRP